MKRLHSRLLLAATLTLVGAVAIWGGRNLAARRAWAAMRPAPPEAQGAAAPGLDARLGACNDRLQTWPPDRGALAEFTRLCHANGLIEPAISGYQALMILEPDEARWPHLLASILAGYGRLDEALPLLRRATVLAPDHLVGWLRLGKALFKANATAEAEAVYRETLKRDPGNPFALLGLARCDLRQDRGAQPPPAGRGRRSEICRCPKPARERVRSPGQSRGRRDRAPPRRGRGLLFRAARFLVG